MPPRHQFPTLNPHYSGFHPQAETGQFITATVSCNFILFSGMTAAFYRILTLIDVNSSRDKVGTAK